MSPAATFSGRRALVYIPPATDAYAATAVRMVAEVLLREGLDIHAENRPTPIAIGSARKRDVSREAFRHICARALRLPVERVPAGDVVVVGDEAGQAHNR